MMHFQYKRWVALMLFLGIACLVTQSVRAEEGKEGQRITLKYYEESKIDDTTPAEEVSTMKYSIVLLNQDGTVSYELPKGVVVPEKYTFQTRELPLQASAFSQMGLSIPGYTLDDGWAFFWWTGNYSGSMYRVTTLRNFGGYSDAYPQYRSYLGFFGLYGNNPGGTGTQSAFDSYVNTTFESESQGEDYRRSYSNSAGYYAYNPTGTLRVVFKQVSENITYKANFLDAFGENQQAANFRQVDQNALKMYSVEGSWNQSTNSYQWYGKLQHVTEEQPEALLHPDYEFVGWYDEMDAYGNGTGKEIKTAEDDTREHTKDVNYYARWNLKEEEKKESLEELPETGGKGKWKFLLWGSAVCIAGTFIYKKGKRIGT